MPMYTHETATIEDAQRAIADLDAWAQDPNNVLTRFWWWDDLYEAPDGTSGWELDDLFSSARPEVMAAYYEGMIATELRWLQAMTVEQRRELDQRNRAMQSASTCFFLTDEPELRAALYAGREDEDDLGSEGY